MSFFGSIGHVLGNVGGAIKKAAVDTGHAVGSVQSNPWVEGLEAAALGATGVGAPAAAALLAANGAISNAIKPGGNLKSSLVGGVEGAASGYGGDKLGAGLSSALSTGGVSGLAKAALPQAVRTLTGGGSPNLSVAPDPSGGLISGDDPTGGGGVVAPSGRQGIPGLPTSISDLLDAGGSALKNNLGQAVNLGTGVLSAAQAAKLGAQSQQYGKDALATAQASYGADGTNQGRAPLRAAGIAGLLNPGQNVDLSGVRGAAGVGNPFAKPIAATPYLPYQVQAST